jgi:hypothetical protein
MITPEAEALFVQNGVNGGWAREGERIATNGISRRMLDVKAGCTSGRTVFD